MLIHRHQVPRKLFYKGDYETMNSYFMDIDWIKLFGNLNTQECTDLFYTHVSYAVDKVIPVSKNIDVILGKKLVNKGMKEASKYKQRDWNTVCKDRTNIVVIQDNLKRRFVLMYQILLVLLMRLSLFQTVRLILSPFGLMLRVELKSKVMLLV